MLKQVELKHYMVQNPVKVRADANLFDATVAPQGVLACHPCRAITSSILPPTCSSTRYGAAR